MVIVLIIALSCLAVRSDGSAYVIYPDATSLSANASLASNIYGSLMNQTYSWTVWLQLSSDNLLTNANLTILSLSSQTVPVASVFLSQGRYLTANITTSSATVETLLVSTEMPPFNQWFRLALCISDQVKIAWKRPQGYSVASTTWAMATPPSPLLSSANLTLEESSAQGFLALVTLSDYTISESELLQMSAPTNMQYVQEDVIGGTAFESSNYLNISCPRNDSVITSIDFAAYGHPVGLFPDFELNFECNSILAPSYIENLCLRKRTCTVPVDTRYYGDPCPLSTKWVSVVASCSYRVASSRGPARVSEPSSPSESALLSVASPPPIITDIDGLQNGYRVRLGLDLDISSSSQTQNRIDARLAVRHASAMLGVDISRFVLIDLICTNQTSAILTFTVLSGSTPSALADGLNITLVFRDELQKPDSQLRENSLLHTAPMSPVPIALECVPIMVCPSGEYICLSESRCQMQVSTMSTFSSTATVSIGIGAVILAAFGGWFVWRNYISRRFWPTSKAMKGPVSMTASEHGSYHVSTKFDVFRVPGASNDLMAESPSPQGEAAEFRLPESGRHVDSLVEVATSTNANVKPSGVASTLSDLEKSFDTLHVKPSGVASTLSDLEKSFDTLHGN